MKKRKNSSRATYFRYDDHEALSPTEVDTILRFHRLAKAAFFDWMIGQTGPVLENGEFGIYWYDLNRYIAWEERGVKPLFD